MDALSQYDTLWLAGLALALVATGTIAGLMAGLLGVGGGIVIVPVLYHLFALLQVDEAVRMHMAVGTSLSTIIPTSIMSARSHYQKGAVDIDLLRTLGPAVLVGAVLGGFAGSLFHGEVLSLIFATIALVVAGNMALRSDGSAVAARLPGTVGKGLMGGGIGAVSAVMGIGGGTLGVPILSAFSFPIRRAVGTASALGLIIGIPGAIGFAVAGTGLPDRPPGSLGYINLIGFALIVPLTMRMAPIGASIAHRIHPGGLRKAFALFLGLTALRMFADMYTG